MQLVKDIFFTKEELCSIKKFLSKKFQGRSSKEKMNLSSVRRMLMTSRVLKENSNGAVLRVKSTTEDINLVSNFHDEWSMTVSPSPINPAPYFLLKALNKSVNRLMETSQCL